MRPSRAIRVLISLTSVRGRSYDRSVTRVCGQNGGVSEYTSAIAAVAWPTCHYLSPMHPNSNVGSTASQSMGIPNGGSGIPGYSHNSGYRLVSRDAPHR